MKNNKLLSIFLLASVAVSIFAGALYVSKERYARSDADVTYKTLYLSVPEEKITDRNGDNAINWDKNGDVRVFLVGKHDKDDPDTGDPMQKIGDHLYSITLDNTYNQFNFLSYIGGEKYWCLEPGNDYHRFNNLSSSANYFVLAKYNCVFRNDTGTWNPAKEYINTAEKFASTFLTVLGTGICDNTGVNTNTAKLSSVWGELNDLYAAAGGMTSDEKALLYEAEINETGTVLERFAALYNFICRKYSYNNYVGRDIVPQAGVTRNPIVTDSGDNTNIIVAVSIGATSVAIVSLYFFIKKKKEK